MKRMSVGSWYYAYVADGYELWQATEHGHVCLGKVYDQPTADMICEKMNEPPRTISEAGANQTSTQ